MNTSRTIHASILTTILLGLGACSTPYVMEPLPHAHPASIHAQEGPRAPVSLALDGNQLPPPAAAGGGHSGHGGHSAVGHGDTPTTGASMGDHKGHDAMKHGSDKPMKMPMKKQPASTTTGHEGHDMHKGHEGHDMHGHGAHGGGKP